MKQKTKPENHDAVWLSDLGFSSLECIHRGEHSEVFRTLDREPALCVKVASSLEREHDIAAALAKGSPHVLTPLALHRGHKDVIVTMFLDQYQALDSLKEERRREEDKPRSNLPVAFGYDMQEEGVSSYQELGIPKQRVLVTTLLAITQPLTELHQLGYAHLDLCEDNILIAKDKPPMLIDFGHCMPLGQEPKSIGRAAYLAPELSAGVASEKADIYSLGVVLFHLLTSTLPFTGVGPETIVKKQSLEAPSMEEVLGHANIFTELVARMLRRRPEQRLTLRELVERLIDIESTM